MACGRFVGAHSEGLGMAVIVSKVSSSPLPHSSHTSHSHTLTAVLHVLHPLAMVLCHTSSPWSHPHSLPHHTHTSHTLPTITSPFIPPPWSHPQSLPHHSHTRHILPTITSPFTPPPRQSLTPSSPPLHSFTTVTHHLHSLTGCGSTGCDSGRRDRRSYSGESCDIVDRLHP